MGFLETKTDACFLKYRGQIIDEISRDLSLKQNYTESDSLKLSFDTSGNEEMKIYLM